MTPTRPRPALALAALALGAALSGCSGSGGAAVDPVEALPSPLQSQVQTDVGEYLVTPRSDLSKQEVADTIKRLKEMDGVQSVERTPEGKVDVVFLGGSTAAQRQAAVEQLSALGEVEQGI